MSQILLDYGSGGRASHRLVSELFVHHFDNNWLRELDDAARLEISGPVAMSTDSYTVAPLFFPGGDIGSLAIHGTINDVSMLGAKPRYLTCAMILEEGLDMAVLEKIVESMGRVSSEAKVPVVTGDTKVVPRGCVDKIFINTTGIGEIFTSRKISGHCAKPEDSILVSGQVGDHGLAILASRQGLGAEIPVRSDSAALHFLVERLLKEVEEIHVLRDPTRGGLATTLNEIAVQSGVEMFLREEDIPVSSEVASGCSFLGLDPLYLANEGKFICIVPEEFSAKALEVLRADPLGRGAAVIGQVRKGVSGRVVLETTLGGHRLLDMLEGEMFPRIC